MGVDHDLSHFRDAICVDSFGRSRITYDRPSELHGGKHRHVYSYGWEATLHSPVNGFRAGLQIRWDLG
jgi:hypothetical protein